MGSPLLASRRHPEGSSSTSSSRRPTPMEEEREGGVRPAKQPAPAETEPSTTVAEISLAEAVQRAASSDPSAACSPCPATGRALRLVARLASRRVQPLPTGVGETGAVPWSLYLEDGTAAVRVVFATASGPPPVQLLEVEEDAQDKPRGPVLAVEGWQCLLGQASSSSSSSSSKKRPGQQQLTPAELAAACVEVSAWRVQQSAWRVQQEARGEDNSGGRPGKRPRVGPRPVYAEGLWATGTARVVSPVLKGRRKRPSASASSSPSSTTTVRAPSRSLLLLRLSPSRDSTIAVVLQGERCLRCQPALRPGRRYHFPLLRPADPEGNEDDRADYWGGAGVEEGAGAPAVFVAVLPPVEIGMDNAEGDKDFAVRPGLFAYPEHRPQALRGTGEGGGPASGGGCLQARVLHFEGVVRAAHRNGKYDLEAPYAAPAQAGGAAGRRVVPVLLASSTLGLGAGLRRGARVRFWNAHPVVLGGKVQALCGCLWTYVEILELAPPPSSSLSLSPRPYLLPANGTHRHRPLAYLAWTIRLRGQLQRKLFGGGSGAVTPAEAAALEPGLNAWAKRLSGVGDLRADPLLPEALLHDASGRPCPAVFGGLPLTLDEPAGATTVIAPHRLLSPPSLVELPSLRAARQEAARRCREALLGGGGWWAVLERAGAGRVETLPLGGFDIAAATEEEEKMQQQPPPPPRALLMGLLVRKRGGGAQLVDATGSLPLYFALAVKEGKEEEEQRLVHWREEPDAPPPGPPFARPFVVMEEEGEEEEEGDGQGASAAATTAVARVGSLPWAEAPPAPRGAAWGGAQAGRMVALRGKTSVWLFADVLSWRRGAPGKAEVEAEGGCIEVAITAGDGVTVAVRIRPFLLVDPAAVLPLGDASISPAPAPPQPPAGDIDWRAARLAPALSIGSRRARADEYWDAPPLRLLVLVKRLEQEGYNGGSSGRVVLLCKDANDPAPAVARLFLYASHRAAGVCAPEPFPGIILLARGLRCRTRPCRRIDLFSAPGCSVLLAGYRPLSPVDRQLAHATFEEPCPHLAHPPTEEEAALALLQSTRPGRLCELAQGREVHFGLLRLQVVVICFKAPSLALKCPACRSFADRCGGRCGARMEPWWEVHCTVDDGTGQANILADGELAVRLLRVEPQRRRRLEAELRAGQAPTGGVGAGWGARREAVGEWLWAELFRDPGERGRRLRRLELVVQEVLLKNGKGDGRPPPQQRLRRCEWVDGERRDVPTVWGDAGGSGGTSTYSLHMPALKAVLVAEADPRLEAYEALRELSIG